MRFSGVKVFISLPLLKLNEISPILRTFSMAISLHLFPSLFQEGESRSRINQLGKLIDSAPAFVLYDSDIFEIVPYCVLILVHFLFLYLSKYAVLRCVPVLFTVSEKKYCFSPFFGYAFFQELYRTVIRYLQLFCLLYSRRSAIFCTVLRITINAAVFRNIVALI